MIPNAGLRLAAVQKAQGTALCIGLDPHYDPNGKLNYDFYKQYWSGSVERAFRLFAKVLKSQRFAVFSDSELTVVFLTGVTCYFINVIDAAWAAGVRVFKPQSSFYELFQQFAPIVLRLIRQHIADLAERDKTTAFVILDAKRGDIDSTQERYYQAYLSNFVQEVMPGCGGQFDFDAMTVTTWMGEDVLTPGLPFFKAGKGAVVVTRSSNPSGTTFQDLKVGANIDVQLSSKQECFRLIHTDIYSISHDIGRPPTVQDVMLRQTEKFCVNNELCQNGVSPIFSVIGATKPVDQSFRILRPTGIALVPGFGAQKGAFANVMNLIARTGPLTGGGVIWSSSRNHNYPWLAQFGGDDDPHPGSLFRHMRRVIDQFRKDEKEAYFEAGIPCPWN